MGTVNCTINLQVLDAHIISGHGEPVTRRRSHLHIGCNTTASGNGQVVDWNCHGFGIGCRFNFNRTVNPSQVHTFLDAAVVVGINGRQLLTK